MTLPSDHQSLVHFADLLKLRSLSHSTRAEYLCSVRRLGVHAKVDAATLSEEQVRAHILKLQNRTQLVPRCFQWIGGADCPQYADAASRAFSAIA